MLPGRSPVLTGTCGDPGERHVSLREDSEGREEKKKERYICRAN